MKKPQIILVGGGGHCKACIDVIENQGVYDIAGVLDLPSKKGEKIFSYEVIGNDDDIPYYAKKNFSFLITLGHLGSPNLRKKIFDIIQKNEGHMPVIISSRAYVSNTAKVGNGSIIMHDAIVNAGARIGKNCIINTKALVEHDVVVKNDVHVSTNATLNGEVVVGGGAFIGSKAVINQTLTICNNALIGSGSVVVNNITEPDVYIGIPSKKLPKK